MRVGPGRLVAAWLIAVTAIASACQLQPGAGGTPRRTPARSPSPPALTLRVQGGFDLSPGQALLPPDAAVAVGPTVVLAATNGRAVLVNRAGKLVANGTTRDLFGPLLRPEELQTDPRAVFDSDSGRFFLVQTVYPLAFAGSGQPACPAASLCHTGTLLAVSTSSEPADLTARSWHTYYATGWRPGQVARPGVSLDFPGLAVGRAAVVITLLVLPGSTAGIRVIDKAAVVAGQPLAGWTDLDQPRDARGMAIGLLQPATMVGGGDSMFLVAVSALGPGQAVEPGGEEPASAQEPVAASPAPGATPGQGAGCAVGVAALTGLPAAPVLTTRPVASRVQCDAVLGAEQPGGARPLEPGAFGLSSSPVYRDGQLWFAHSVAHGFGGGFVDAIHWGQVDVRGWPRKATMVQESLLGTAGVWSFCPAVMVSAAGQLIVAYARSSMTEFPSVYFAGRGRDDPPGSMRGPTLVKAGLAAENLSPNRRNRYGDYFAAALDPLDGSVWILGEYGHTGNQAGIWLGHIV